MKSTDLTQAREIASRLAELLQAANRQASAVESMLLLPMIERAAKLAQDVGALQTAIRQDAPIDRAKPDAAGDAMRPGPINARKPSRADWLAELAKDGEAP